MKKVLGVISKILGFLGFSLVLASAVAGYIAEGKDVVILTIVGFGLLILSLAVYFVYLVLDSPVEDFKHVVFPEDLG